MTTWRVRTFPCEGGWYWEILRCGVKVNGGIAPDEETAQDQGWRHIRGAKFLEMLGS